MRKLQTSDLFNALRLIRKANLREELKPILKLAGSGELKVEDVGIEAILGFVEILAEKKAEQAIYEVLAHPFDMTTKEVEQLDLITLAEMLGQLSRENDLKHFFTLLASMNSKR